MQPGLLAPNHGQLWKVTFRIPVTAGSKFCCHNMAAQAFPPIRRTAPPPLPSPSQDHAPKVISATCLRVGFLGAPGWRQRAEVGEIPSKSNERPQPVKSTPLFNILTIMQTGISRLLLNSIKLEDEDNAEREHAVNTAWTTLRGAWGGCRSLEEGAGAHRTLGGH